MGAGFGFAGFAEGFAKAFTEARREQRQTAAKKDEFITEQLIKGALTDPKAVAESPELLADIEKRLGPQGGVFTEFLKQHAKNIQDDDIIGQLLKPEGGAAPAPTQPAAPPEAALIGGMSPVTQPGMVEPPAPQAPTAPQAPPLTPTVQPGTMSRKQTAAASQVGATLASMREQLVGEIEAGRMTEEQAIKQLNAAAAAGLPEGDLSGVPAGAAPAATPAAPGAPTIPTVAPSATAPKTRAEAIQRKLLPGQTLKVKGKDKAELTLQGGAAADVEASQLFQGFRQQGASDVDAADAAWTQLTNAGKVAPKWVTDLAFAKTKNEIAAKRAAAEEVARRGVKIANPQTADEFRASAASGQTTGQVHGREITTQDLTMIDQLNAAGNDFVIQTLPDGTYVSRPRAEALASGRPLVNPSTYAAGLVAANIRNKSGAQETNARIVLKTIDNLLARDVNGRNALDLLEPARPGESGIAARLRAETKGRYRVWDLAQKGDPHAVELQDFMSMSTSIGRAFGQSANMSDADRKRFETLSSGVANGRVARQRGEADLLWLRDKIVQLAGEGLLGESGAGARRDGTERANTQFSSSTTSSTSTTLPFGARVVEEGGKRYLEYPD